MFKKITLVFIVLTILFGTIGCKKKEETVQNNKEVIENKTGGASSIDDLDATLSYGVDPGLGVKVLHELGYTGGDVVIAYADQGIKQPFNEEYKDNIIEYHDLTEGKETDSMHGASVLSLLCGTNIGTAPDAKVYFISYYTMDNFSSYDLGECLDEAMKINKGLDSKDQIKMIGYSNNVRDDLDGKEDFIKKIKEAEDSGIMVFFCGDYVGGRFEKYSDKSNPDNLILELGDLNEGVAVVPESGRTTVVQNDEYQYWLDDGGLSWTMPYMLGLYAIALGIDPTLTKDDIYQNVKDTNSINKDGLRVVNPVEFIAKVLERVNRTEDAKELREAYINSFNYTYILYNSSKVNNDDLDAINNYKDGINSSRTILFDTKEYKTSIDLYKAIQNDHINRGGNIVGIQIMGDIDSIPSFSIHEKVDMGSFGLHETGDFYSDLLYQNIDNDISKITNDFSVYKFVNENIEINLTPQYPLARLPLSKGEYVSFFKKYNNFKEETNLVKQTLVNFSNPIFDDKNHIDDMSYFLDRMASEFYYLNDYKKYGNKLGQCPVVTETEGGFTKEEMASVNKEMICEFLINSHGQKNNIDKCWFENDKEVRESFINSDNINKTLNTNPYYLDVWTCNNGEGMKDNLTTTALKGNCVGMFSATSMISNNGVDNNQSIAEMKLSNFYYFYFTYIKTLNNGYARSLSFYKAQYKYVSELLKSVGQEIDSRNNYQFNLNNALVYHNFGVLENYDLSSVHLDDVDTKETFVRKINKVGEFYEIDTSYYEKNDFNLLKASYTQDKSNFNFDFEFEMEDGYEINYFYSDNQTAERVGTTTKGSNYLTLSIDKNELQERETLVVMICKSDDDRVFIFVNCDRFRDQNQEINDNTDKKETKENSQNENEETESKTNNQTNTFYDVDLSFYQKDDFKVIDGQYSKEKDGYNFSFDVNVGADYQISYFTVPEDGGISKDIGKTTGEKQHIEFFIDNDSFEKAEYINLMIWVNDNDRIFIMIQTSKLK